jgi:ribosome biogenesis GTPase
MSLEAWGWNEYFDARLSAKWCGKPARVVFASRGVCRLSEDDRAIAAPPGMEPVAGDWVVYDPTAARVMELLERRTRISRKAAGAPLREQVLAANVDVLFIVAGLDGDYNLRRLERYLVMARQSGTAPVIVLNKSDLCEDALARLGEVDRLTVGVDPVVLVSALDAGSLMQLHRFIEPGQTGVLVGSSGAGKSTIVNALLGEEAQRTCGVRADDSRGRHTTVGRHLFRLPAGWLLIDTPGLRELSPWAPAEAVAQVFEDIEQAAAHCRFRDCRHQGEPGCAVAEAVARGQLDGGRVENYQKLTNEVTELERKRRWKIIHKAVRNMPDKRG